MWNCGKCAAAVEDAFEVCWKCGTSRDGVEDPTFRPEIEAGKLAEPPAGPAPANLLAAAQSSEPDHPLARGLVWVFRGLAVAAAIWGLFHVANTIEAARTINRIVPPGFPFDGGQLAQDAQKAGTIAVFTSLILTFAAVAFPLAVAEILRLCLLIEAKTRADVRRSA